MPQQELKLKVSADVAEGVAGIKQVEAEVNKLGGVSNAAQSKVKSLSLTVETLQAKIQARKEFLLRETDLTKIAQYNREISSLESVVNQIKNSGKDGFWGGKPIAELNKQTAKGRAEVLGLASSFSSLVGPLSKAYSGLRIVANIIPGLGIAGLIGGIFSVGASLLGFGDNTEKATKKLEEHKTEAELAAEKQKAFSEAVDKAASSVVQQADKLEDLKALFKSTTPELQNLTEATIKQGVAQFVFDQKNEGIQKLLSAQVQLAIQTKKTNDLLAGVPEVTTENFSKNPLIKQIGQAKSDLKQLNALGVGLEDVISNIFDKQFSKKGKEKTVKVKKIKIEPREVLLPLDKVENIKSESRLGSVKLPNVKLNIPVDIQMKLDNIENLRKQGAILQDEFNKIFSSGFANGFANIGESIGQAIAAGENPIVAAGMSILGTIGDLIQQIGKSLIEYGVVKQGLDKVLAGGIFVPGALAIGLGVAAVAVGALIKASFKNVKGFADGGLVFGPTMGLVGEGKGTTRSNPEVIAPLDQLKKFIGGNQNQQQLLPKHAISGSTLLLWYERAAKSEGRRT